MNYKFTFFFKENIECLGIILELASIFSTNEKLSVRLSVFYFFDSMIVGSNWDFGVGRFELWMS